MRRAEGYAIADEPVPSRWTHLAVSPAFPLFGFMLGGAWLGWAWFTLNAHAFGSATRKRETVVALLSPLAASALLFTLAYLADHQLLSARALPYALLSVAVLKVASMYWLFNAQLRSFAIYEYFDGRRRNAAPVLVVALLFGRELIEGAPGWLRLVLQ